jgi:hypothetical protein
MCPELAMYACMGETGHGCFEGVCAPCNASPYSCDPPPPHHSRTSGTPALGAPARIRSITALAWTALRLGVDVEHDPGYVVPVNEQGYFARGMDFLAPGAELSTLWGSMRTLPPLLRERELEDGVTITSRNKSLTGEYYESVWTVNPLLVARRIYTEQKTLAHVVRSLDKISSKL